MKDKLASQHIAERLTQNGISTKSRNALNNLVAACDFLDQQKLEIRVAAVGKFCEGRIGGPRAQSIRNNSDYKSYVVARRSEQGIVAAETNSSERKYRTGELNADAYIQTLEYELVQTKAELKDLRRALPRLGEYDLKSALDSGTLIIEAAEDRALPAQAISAIKTILDQDSLNAAGLELVKTGQIIAPDQNNVQLLSKQQVEALSQLLKGKAMPSGRTPLSQIIDSSRGPGSSKAS